MSTITSKQGDTFASLSRRAYGTEKYAQTISRANPAYAEPLAAGALLTVPALPAAPVNPPRTIEGDGITVRVGGSRFTEWTDVSLQLAIDAPPQITLFSPWDPDEAELRRVFKPFSFQSAAVNIGSDPIFTGVMLTPSPTSTAEGSTIMASGYGRTGTPYDCNASASSYPLEFDNLTLDAIANQLLTPFGVGVQFEAPVGAPFERVSMQPGEPVLTFLAGLAKQRNMVIGETTTGQALFWQSVDTGSPVAVFKEGEPPVERVTPSFSAQNVYSDITAIAPTVPGVQGEQLTVKNSRLNGVVRPHTFIAPDTPGETLQTAADAKLGRMYGAAVAWYVEVPAWRGPNGDVWRPNTTVKLTAPKAMIYNQTEFLIKSVHLSADSDHRSARLELVLPGAFSGKLPERLPWE